MEDFARRISVQTEGTSNVLVIELQAGEALIPYCSKVMECNAIPGLLPMRHQSMDGVVRLRYNIGGKVPLREFMIRHHLPYKNGVLLLRNLCEALLHLNEYFLSADMCYLDPEHIYVGDGLAVYLPCVPVSRETGHGSAARLKQFFEKLLSEYFATADCSSYDDMFKWVYKATLFDLETFYRKFLQDAKETPAPAAPAPQPAAAPAAPAPQPRPAPAPAPAPQPAPAPAAEGGHELTELLQEKMKGLQAIYPGVAEEKPELPKPPFAKAAPPAPAPDAARELGFAIPGAPAPKGAKKEKPEKEKKAFWPFGAKPGKDAPAPAQPEHPAPHAPAARPDAPHKAPAGPAPAAPAAAEWEDGTILVGQETPAPAAQPPAAVPAAYLVHHDQKIPIRQTPFLVGKYNTSIQLHYSIYDNNKVSRNHATILQENGRYFVRDNQSRNGTSVNGKAILPLQPAPLQDGDEIKLYDEVLVFHLGEV